MQSKSKVDIDTTTTKMRTNTYKKICLFFICKLFIKNWLSISLINVVTHSEHKINRTFDH